MWATYLRSLTARPIRTQMGTSAVLWCLGDLIAQETERRLALKLRHGHGDEPSTSTAAPRSTDWKRVGIQTGYAAFIWAPAGHYWYEMLDRTAHRLAVPASRRFIGVKMALEMVALHPLSLLAFFSCVGLANAEPVREIGAQIRRDLPPSLALEWAMWTPLDLVNFVFVPVRHQLLVNNTGCLVESGVLSLIRANGFNLDLFRHGAAPDATPACEAE